MQEIKTTTMWITPNKAEELLSKNTMNRAVKQRVVDRYANDMSSGLWKRNGETIKIAYDGTILDGQHRLLAVIKSGVSNVMDVTTGLDKDSIYTIDCGSSRSASDSLKIEGVKNYMQASTISTAFLSVVTSNSVEPYFSKTGNFVKPSVASVVNYFNDNRDYIERVAGMMSSKKYRIVLSVPMAALIYSAGSYVSDDDAMYFLEKMVSGESLNAGDPILETRRVLIEDMRSKTRKMPLGIKNAIILKAWNKFILGESVKYVRFRMGGSSREKFPEMIDYYGETINYFEALPHNGVIQN